MSKLLDDQEIYNKYNEINQRAKTAYNEKLWNGTYYNYDNSNNNYKDSIMADMCCGHWYMRCSGLNYEVRIPFYFWILWTQVILSLNQAFEKDRIKSCLKKIYEFNVVKYGNCKLGAVNGMRPNGEIDTSSLQSEEMWIGVTNSVASLMIYEVFLF